MRIFLALVLAIAAPLATGAETRYITDRVEITVRTGPSLQNRILRLLPSGTAVELLETDAESGYSRVRIADGTEGWVITRYLMAEPAARERVAAARERIGALEAQLAELRTRLAEAEAERDRLRTAGDDAAREAEKVRAELERIRKTAAEALRIDRERKELKAYARKLEGELQTLRAENDALRDQSARDWFVAGAGVLLVGLLTGLVLARMRRLRRSSWDSF